MIGWAATFFIIAIIAGVLGFTGIAGTAVHIAWILFVVGLILAVVFTVFGRRRPLVFQYSQKDVDEYEPLGSSSGNLTVGNWATSVFYLNRSFF